MGGPSQQSRDGVKAVEAMALRLVGEWKGAEGVIDEKALRRWAEPENTKAAHPDAARRAKAIDESVSGTHQLYRKMTHILVINKHGSYTKTSWGTGAYSDGKPQKGTWKVTKATDAKADFTLTIQGREVPCVVKFPNDGDFTLRISESMPRYSDYNRAIAERNQKKRKTPAKKAA